MFGESVRSRRHAGRRPAATSAGLTFLKADDAQRIMDRERQRDGTPLAVLVEHQLGLGGSATGQRSREFESPVVFVAAKHLPAAFLVVPDAPHPVAAAELRWDLPGRLVQRNHARAFRRRITHSVPDGLRRLADIRRVGAAAAEVKDGPATGHIHPAVRFRRVGQRTAWSPGAAQFKDREPWTIAQTHDRPLHTGAGFFPQDAG